MRSLGEQLGPWLAIKPRMLRHLLPIAGLWVGCSGSLVEEQVPSSAPPTISVSVELTPELALLPAGTQLNPPASDDAEVVTESF
jgi:hypothetical protein